MELEGAREIAEEIKGLLEPACDRIVIAGSIRRGRPDVGDIELLAIPRCYPSLLVDLLDQKILFLISKGFLGYRLNKRGSRMYGPLNKLLTHARSGVGVDIFSTNELCWWVALVVRTGGKITNQRISTAALRQGWRFHAYGAGFTSPEGEIFCASEQEVFAAVGLPYELPERRA